MFELVKVHLVHFGFFEVQEWAEIGGPRHWFQVGARDFTTLDAAKRFLSGAYGVNIA